MADSDDEYGPIASTWGSQSTLDQSSSWHSLADPKAKTGLNGIGSGMLHRQGKNFMPVPEEQILAHRLNLGPTKKKLLPKETSSPKKQNRKNLNKSSTKQPKNPVKKVETPALISRPPPKSSEMNSWNSQTLVETPFWDTTCKIDSKDNISTDNHLQPEKHSKSKSSTLKKKLDINNTTNEWGYTNTLNINDKNKAIESKNDPEEWNQDASWGAVKTVPNTLNWGTKVEDDSRTSNWGKVVEDNKETAKWEALENSSSQITDWPTNHTKQPIVDLGGWGTESVVKGNEFASSEWNSFSQTSSNNPLTPSWMGSYNQNSSKSGRSYQFSNPSKKKYSEYKSISVPRPMNYTRDKEIPIPTEVAPAPPPENAVVITIHVELSDTIKIPVTIRDLDEPQQLAKHFAETNNVNTESVVQALTKLFESQKAAALKKRNQKLFQRKNFQSHNTRYSSSQGNAYNNYTHNSSSNSFNATAPVQQIPFTRSQYY